MTARVVSLQVGMPQRHVVDGKPAIETAIFKTTVPGPVRVHLEHLEGDMQANLKAHGGPDRAVLAYAAGHYPRWREAYAGHDFPFGSFGENFTVEGLDEETVCVGDVYRIGGATLQVTMPRTPCPKIDRRTGIDGILKQVMATRRIGWLHRVLEEGDVTSGDAVALVERPHPEWTVDRVYVVMKGLMAKDAAQLEDARRLLEVAPLGAQYKHSFSHLISAVVPDSI